MPGKRRTTKAPAAAASTTTSNETSSDLQTPSTVLRHLLEIATSKSRSEGVLQAFFEGKCWTEPQPIPGSSSSSPTTKPSKEPHLDCYWIILATSLMNRLLVLEDREDSHGKNDKAKHEGAVYLTAVADAVATVLLSDKNKLEKSSHHGSSRSVLCRAVLTSSMASLHCVRNFDQPSTLEAAVATLDRLVHLKPSASKGDASTTKLSTAGLWTEDELAKECERVGRLLGKMELEAACVKALVGATSDSTGPSLSNDHASEASDKSPPPKRAARSRRGAKTPVAVPAISSSSLPSAAVGTATPVAASAETPPIQTQNTDRAGMVLASFQELMTSDEFGSRIDGRVAIKRWASIALVWSQKGEGQLQLLRATHELAATSSSTLTASQKSSIMFQLVCIASEAGANCGVRPPSGGIDQYLKSIAVKRQQKHRKAGAPAPKKAKILRRADIRDWTTVVIYDFLQNHKICLQSVESHRLGTYGVVNGDSVESGNKDEEQDKMTSEIFLAPDFGSAITGLCRSASSSVPNSSYSEQASWNKALTSIAAANCIELIADPSLPLDCKLAQFVAAHIADCLRRVDPDSMGTASSSDETNPVEDDFTSTDPHPDFDSMYIIRKALPKPSIFGEGTGVLEDQDRVTLRNCTFAGVLAADGASYSANNFTDEQAVSLAIRALQRRKGDQSSAAGKIWAFLIEMISRLYDTRKPSVETATQVVDEMGTTNKRKRSSKTTAANRRGRRRKTDQGEAAIRDETTVWHQITSLRASVASDFLASLRCCLMKTRRSATTIRQLIRRSVKIEHLQNIIRLGDMLDQFIIKTRVAGSPNLAVEMKDQVGDVPETSVLGASSLAGTNQDYTHFEKQLWSAHMDMCQVFGRGQLNYAANSGLDPLLWGGTRSTNRYVVYKTISGGELECKWPLSLPSAHLSFLFANMSCSAIADDKSIERRIVAGILDSVEGAFQNFESLQDATIGEEICFLDDEIPFSYNDAKCFMLAINGLPPDEKLMSLERLVKATKTMLSSILAKTNSGPNEICKNSDASGFLARVLVVCYSLMNSIIAGGELQIAFLATVGCSEMNLPAFVTHGDWYRRDRTFMGLFGSWESPSLPDGFADRETTHLPENILTDLRSVLEMSFSLGFDSAGNDHCYLLFTAWNGLDQLPRDDGSLNPAGQVPTVEAESTDYVRMILDMREDVCCMHNAIGRAGMRDKGTIMSSTNSGSTWSDSKLKCGLKGMIMRANALVESLLRSHVPDDDEMTQEIPMPVFVLLASIPTYISFSIACHSKAGNDYFSAALSKTVSRSANCKRQRGYSSESDLPVESEGDSTVETDDHACYEHDIRIEALSRLKECCDAFGAAPMHPDWLDVSCILQDGVRPNEAVEAAELAMKTLASLITVAFSQYKRRQFRALKAVKVNDRSEDKNANLAMSLLSWMHEEVAGPSHDPNDRDWRGDVVSVTEIPEWVFEDLLDEQGSQDVEQAKSYWCPFAGQRLRGLLQEGKKLVGGCESPAPAERRAGGEWEILLSEALAISCIHTTKPQTGFQEFRRELTMARLWRTIFLTCTSNLMPIAGLLRLGIAKVGRKPHPFIFHENIQDPYSVGSLRFSERLLGATYSSHTLTVTVFETLTILSRLCVEGEESLYKTCQAIASHLLVNSDSFRYLQCQYSLRCTLIGLKRIREVAESSPKRDVKNAIPIVVQLLVGAVKEGGKQENIGLRSPSRECLLTGFQGLHHFLGRPGLCLVDTLVGSIDAFEILKTGKMKELHQDYLETYHWSDEHRQRKAISELVSTLCSNSLQANDRTRSQIAIEMAQSLVTPFTDDLIQAFNGVDKKRLRSLLLRDLCGIRSDSPPPNFGKKLGRLLALLLFTKGGAPEFEKSRYVHDTLISALDFWKKIQPSEKEHILCVMIIYSLRHGNLMNIGEKLLEAEEDSTAIQSLRRAKLLSFFLSSIRQLQDVLGGHDLRSSLEAPDAIACEKPKFKGGDDFPRSCSFIQKTGFHGQHWYHCHTCNLVADKGCCSLCALVCHRDHDVAYSRYSSFFCDCAAEDGHPGEHSRVSCKCLSTIPQNEVEKIYENEFSLGESPRRSEATGNKDGFQMQGTSGSSDLTAIIDIARVSFRDAALKSVADFIKEVTVKESPWLDALFLVLDQEFKIWKANNENSMIKALLQENSKAGENSPVYRLSHDSLQRRLRNRRSKVLSLQHIDMVQTSCLTPIRQTVKGCFQATFSSDSATNTLTVARLARNDIQRSIVVSDSRGRMVCAEPCSLVFFCPVPAVNIRYVKRSCHEELPRHKMCILGTAALKFNVVGLSLNPDNERHLVVWGTSEACVVIIKADYSGIEDTVNLVFELDHQGGEGDYLVKCEWLPRSQTHVAVGCSRSVRLYDICRLDSEKRASPPVIGYNLGFESSLRDLSIVPCGKYTVGNGSTDGGASRYFEAETVSKLFLLLENGRLHALDLKTSKGKIESPGEQLFEPSECLAISTAGIRPRLASPTGPPGASTRTMGEGSSLAYLKQSRVLLYKCKSAAVVAMLLDEDGIVQGTFELLPHTISTESLGSDDDGYSITGPYTHWTELGIVYRQSATFFRVSCLGRSTRGSQPKILCVEFNDTDVRIKELAWSLTDSLGLGIYPNTSFEGLAAFSTPILDTESLSSLRCEYLSGERAHLCALTSEGTILIFGEESTDVVPINTHKDSGLASRCSPVKLVLLPVSSNAAIKKPEFPLTLFERLKNVSESNEVDIDGDDLAIDSSDLRSKLSRDSTASIACTRRAGCFLRIRMVPKSQVNLAIAAVRILVGSTLDAIPGKVFVQGRPIEITPRVKRWYNVPLTNEEIAMGLRIGFVACWIGPSLDPSKCPVFDGVEVFAIPREHLETVVPTSYFSMPKVTTVDTSLVRMDDDKVTSNSLVLSVHALSAFFSLTGPVCQISDNGRKLLQQIIEETALHPEKHLRRCIEDLLECVEPNKISRWLLQDESLLVGCTRSLEELKELVKKGSCEDSGEEPNATWKLIRIMLKDCLITSSTIARERPINYLQSMGNMLEKKVPGSSIALEAASLIVGGLRQCSECSEEYEDLIVGPEGIVALSLTETAIDLNSDASKSQKFAQFGNIRAFLDDKKVSVVEKCCDAISSFFHESIKTSHDLFVQLEAARLVVFKCDMCGLCPITGEIRYTDEGSAEDYGIDLCKDCYRIGLSFSKLKKYAHNTQVVIKGKTVGGETKLTCAHMKEMKPVSLRQVEILSSKRNASSEEPIDEDEDLQKALKLSLGENMNDQQGDLPSGYQGYSDFLGAMFAFVMDMVSSTLKKDHGGMNVGPLIKLALDLLGQSKLDSLMHDRVRHFVKEVANGISHIVGVGVPSKLDQEKTFSLVTCLRALSNLLAPDEDSETFIPGSKPDDFDPSQSRCKDVGIKRFVCDAHGIPAVRRRCAKGVNKDRRFYVCGKEKGERCAFFRWVDERAVNSEQPKPKSQFHDVIKAFLWNCSGADIPLHSRLCSLLETELLGADLGTAVDSIIAVKTKVSKGEKSLLKSIYDLKSVENEFSDGVFCSKEKLGDVVSGEALMKATVAGSLELEPCDSGTLLLEAAVGVLTLVADQKTDGCSRWLSFLCEITMTTNQPALKTLAMNSLKAFCGGKRALYQGVRDHFAFAFQLRKLYHLSSDFLDAALIVTEKVRLCTTEWATTENRDWSNLCSGDLIGTQDLISEDAVIAMNATAAEKVLADLFFLIKNGMKSSWRNFCGQSSLGQNATLSQQRQDETVLASVAPITALLWIASASTGANQVKVLRLIDFALTDFARIKASGGSSEEDGYDDLVESGGATFGYEATAKPELILMSGDRKLTVSDILAFTMKMVHSGKTTELRRVACQVASKLVQTLSDDDKWILFQNLAVAVEKIGELGKASADFFSLLQLLARHLSPRNGVGAFAELVLEGFLRQMDAIKYGEWAQLETANSNTVVRRTKIDMSGCFFCLKPHQPAKRETAGKGSGRRVQPSSNGGTTSGTTSGACASSIAVATTRASASFQKWHLDQVCPFARGRLESGKDSSTCSEFSSFYKLKYRVAISDISLMVNEPRGRYVKTIKVFFSPRPVAVVAELKADQYSTKWQLCAVLSLSRGATRASASLAFPVVAANIKFEFSEFYERPGEKERAGDGSMVVHCPRCTRVVTNAHGVCGNCGEVAFQCRKCRHINYDRLDAFLCVECGYCPMGSFSFEVNVGVVTNAIAITNDNDFSQALKMLGTATSVQEELREALGEKLRSLSVRKQKQSDLESFFDSAMERAFLGLPPDDIWEGKDTPSKGQLRSRIDKQGSVVKLVARPAGNHGTNDRTERTRSLLRLARQIRSESGSSAERRRSTDVIIRHFGRGMALDGLDGLDDEDDLVDLLGSGSILDSAEAAVGASNAAGRLEDVDQGLHRRKKEEQGEASSSRKSEIEECLKLTMQLKEAGREAYELRRRISAWKCLESGCLVVQPKCFSLDGTLSGEDSFAFSPSHCPVCRGSVAHQLLVLWLRLFLVDPSQVRVDNKFVELLVQDDVSVNCNSLSHQSKGLGECKKEVLVSIATKSDKGAAIVLDVLKTRLAASQDINCAEILGKILVVEGFSMSEEYTKLAMAILATQSTAARSC